jgi:hypothetical protein
MDDRSVHGGLLAMQRSIGNRAVQALLVQRDLDPDDPHRKEAGKWMTDEFRKNHLVTRGNKSRDKAAAVARERGVPVSTSIIVDSDVFKRLTRVVERARRRTEREWPGGEVRRSGSSFPYHVFRNGQYAGDFDGPLDVSVTWVQFAGGKFALLHHLEDTSAVMTEGRTAADVPVGGEHVEPEAGSESESE